MSIHNSISLHNHTTSEKRIDKRHGHPCCLHEQAILRYTLFAWKMSEAGRIIRQLENNEQNNIHGEINPFLTFLAANPKSELERQNMKAIVRANAANFGRRKNKKAKSRAKALEPTSILDSSDKIRYRYSWRLGSGPETERSCNILEEAQGRYLECEHDRASAASQSNQILIDSPPFDSLQPASMMGLSTLIGMGHLDPFEAYPSDLPRDIISPILDQGEHSWHLFVIKIGKILH